jgi:hypothetical protein
MSHSLQNQKTLWQRGRQMAALKRSPEKCSIPSAKAQIICCQKCLTVKKVYQALLGPATKKRTVKEKILPY